MTHVRRALVTGANGFVGSRLLPALAEAGWAVRAAARQPAASAKARPEFDWVHLDVHDEATLRPALEGCSVAFFLVHSLKGATIDYDSRDTADARSFRRAAESTGLERIVYLGGLVPRDATPSKHLAGRAAVGEELRSGAVACIELRASMIIGAGSASFQMLRDLAARLPAMVLPRWLDSRTEPVAIDDVVASLVAAAMMTGVEESDVFDLEGAEILTCREILLRTARLLGVQPRTMNVPVLTPRLSSWWIRFVSGVDVPLARELVDGLTADLVASRRGFRDRAGLPPPLPFDEAVKRALAGSDNEDSARIVRWWEALVPKLSPRRRPEPVDGGGGGRS